MATLYCQKCRTPLKLDSSLEDLNPASFKILADAAPVLEPRPPVAQKSAATAQRRQQYDVASRSEGTPLQSRGISDSHRLKPKMNPDMSYIDVTESILASDPRDNPAPTPTKQKTASKRSNSLKTTDSGESASEQLAMAARLFEILSSRSDIDHPICSECTDLLLDGLQKRQASVLRERDAYIDFLKKVQGDMPTDEEKAQTKRDLEDAQRREREALEELEALEAEKAKMEDEIAALDVEAEELDQEEEQFWQQRNAFTVELAAFQEERDSLQAQLAHDTKVLEALQRTNVYNDTFVIGHDGFFGTINGLRLGRLPDRPVEWAEINAAWGQVVLLLSVVAEKLGCSFKEYKLVPIGSTSKIVKYDLKQQSAGDARAKGSILELYSSGNLSLGLGGLFHGKFDEAMIAFLDCLRMVGENVERTTSATTGTTRMKLPYRIVKDKIGDVSIRLGNFGQDEQWTKACKFTLTCCKFLLAHASHIDDARPR
ncbi:autophagy protein Apg6-domain-containing protein [Neohortaea acidophila]|uniref:Autophagy protein Apg6-domain-containing protein n=1 Tax=Neohortaea acidophila TaxID=245834 RepID=A0A6A6Q000_9PEZI|nr:autophagy protein Apg6-domain-containing protein [Neohortaea acidophila]KAF2485351.1 autophagy protein Apg6-domain-containing protein [Neohortaea acidophila]